MSTHEWRDPTLVWLRLRQLQYVAVRLGQQSGKPLASMHAMERLQEELFHTAQLLPPPPEKPYYTYTPPVSLHSYQTVGGDWKYPRGQTPVLQHVDSLCYHVVRAEGPSMAEQILGHLEIIECSPSEQRGRLIEVDHSTIAPDTPAPVMFTEHGPL